MVAFGPVLKGNVPSVCGMRLDRHDVQHESLVLFLEIASVWPKASKVMYTRHNRTPSGPKVTPKPMAGNFRSRDLGYVSAKVSSMVWCCSC